MGMTVLYTAFGFVALWLLAEVLMQYKARLRWRLLAFAGFAGVVAGVVLPSVLVIAVGATAFAIGQTLVTLSFRKGFVAGWALRRSGEPVRQQRGRRRGGGARAERPAPTLEVTGLEYGDRTTAGRHDGADAPDDFDDRETNVFTPQPVPEDTGSYGIQSFAPQYGDPSGRPAETAAFASPFAAAGQDGSYAPQYDAQPQGGYDYSGGYPMGEQQVYAAYSDPYIGTGGGVTPPQNNDYAPYPDYSGQQYAMDTPPGGVWVPQQRSTDEYGGQAYPTDEEYQQQQQYPYQGGSGEYEQYRY
ncbi:hypothetical protein [Streptomyces sp. H27-H5]|uniref:hypothetical protein n=1 Tax=Streptomyces sp. H27-H5 TaxID=2996460 RepID=UPI00227086CD|nr:hypothetical protein [Streptomyces sp. H27-H5]MCY0960607.1 hypothetical protein [Streptomyces sp. H27-H5]